MSGLKKRLLSEYSWHPLPKPNQVDKREIEFGLQTYIELQELEIELGPYRDLVGNKYCFEDCITYDGEFYYLGKEIYTGIRGNEVG